MMMSMSSTREDAERLAEPAEAALLGEAAFERLYAQAARPLWSYLYRVLGNAAQAEDLVQDAFLRLLKAPVGRLDADAQRAYLFRIAGNLAVDAFRSGRREARAHDVVEREQPHAAAPAERDIDTARGFAALEPRERALLWMAYVEGAPHQDIASSLQVKTASVKVLLFRARKRLAGLLGSGAAPGDRR
jgi:RNA polymerase sigma-70 factor (ECF subfamily)